MSDISIQPKSAPASVSYRQKLSWEIREEDWNRANGLKLHLKIEIPGTHQTANIDLGGCIVFSKEGIAFVIFWSKDVDVDNIHVDAAFGIKTNDGKCSVAIKSGQRKTASFSGYTGISVMRLVTINPEKLYDERRSFTVEAELAVEMNDAKKISVKRTDNSVKDIKSIFHDEKNSDVLVIVENKEFKCHKNILSARSEVFKNTLAHNTIESNTSTIEIKEVPAKAVEDLLKHIYSGDIPDDPKCLSTDLLHLADMHQLHSLKEACVKNLLESLDVLSCISTFILVDRYSPHNGDLREMVITFMQCKAIEVVEEEDWDKLVDTHPALAKEVMRAIVRGRKEKHRCRFCIVSYE